MSNKLMNEKPVIIEFFGMAGAGKSTLSRLVAEKLMEDKVTIEQPTYDIANQTHTIIRLIIKTLLILRQLLINFLSVFFIIKNIYCSNQMTKRDFLKNVINFIYIYSLCHCVKQSVCLMDQGGFQAVWSVLFSSTNSEGAWKDKLYQYCQQTALVIIVDAALPTIKKRLRLRPGNVSRLEQRKGNRELYSFEKAYLLYENMKAELLQVSKERQGITVLVIDNESEDSLSRNAEKAASFIREYIQSTKNLHETV